MAEDQNNTETNAEDQPKRGGKLKPIILVIAVLLIEGVIIIGTMMLSGGPAPAKGEAAE